MGLSESQYEDILKTCSDKINGENDLDWKEIVDKYNLDIHYDTLRKASQTIFGGAFVKDYFENKGFVTTDNSSYDERLKELRKERMKLQTANLERNRLDRNEARQELYYEQIGSLCQRIPVPTPVPCYSPNEKNEISYIVAISDQHYGATFESERNQYSPEIFNLRLRKLADELISFIEAKNINQLAIVSLGDSIQGILRLSDLNINDTSVVKAVVDYSRTIALFLSELSMYTNISYYHVPTANHSQIRPLNSKASELGSEDLEYVISNYIKDLVSNNPRIICKLADNNKQYIKLDEEDVADFNVYALHGHQVKNTTTILQDMKSLTDESVDYIFMGHFHGGKETTISEGCYHDCEVLVCPSFIGSDPYSDSLFTGSKGAVKIYGFDKIYGHTESYKIILD